jgi:hypothetical protein
MLRGPRELAKGRGELIKEGRRGCGPRGGLKGLNEF